jgi:hypothetical protein
MPRRKRGWLEALISWGRYGGRRYVELIEYVVFKYGKSSTTVLGGVSMRKVMVEKKMLKLFTVVLLRRWLLASVRPI